MYDSQERVHFEIGETASLTRTIGDSDIQMFSEISGDTNPIHLDDEYAQRTRFGRRVAHGCLVAGVVSAVLGTRLPGPGAIYLSQTLRFTKPVYPGDTITARASVKEWDGATGRITLVTEVVNQEGKLVLTGEARLVMSAFLGSK